MKRTQWLVAVPVLFAAAAFAKEKDPAAAEAKLKPEAAKLVLEYAAWCSSNGAKKAGAASLEEAASLDPQAPKLAETKGALEALADDAADADAVAKQRKAAGPKIASAYDKLAALDHDAKDDGRFEDYLFKALAWEPSAARIAKVRRAVDDAAGRPDQAGRLLVKLKRADADGAAAGRYDKLETDMALKDVVLLGSESHALVGYVSLPRDWAKGKTYPVVVGVEGAGCNFLGYCRGLMNARGSRSAIVVAPVTLSNTNPQTRTLATYPCYTQAILDEWGPKALGFDGPGVDALLAVVTKRFGGEEKVFLTGFSGGGLFTYYKLLQDPSHVRGAAPCCGNFGGGGAEGAPGAGPDGGPPVHLFTGEKDQYRERVGVEPGIEAQTDNAQAVLKQLGYKRVDRTMVKGAGHDALPAMVWKFVDQVLGGK